MNPLLVNFFNLVLCAAMAWAAVCRLNAIHWRVRARVSLQYVGLLVVAALSGLQFFFFGTLATWGQTCTAGGACALLWVTMPQWRKGPPRHTLRALR